VWARISTSVGGVQQSLTIANPHDGIGIRIGGAENLPPADLERHARRDGRGQQEQRRAAAMEVEGRAVAGEIDHRAAIGDGRDPGGVDLDILGMPSQRQPRETAFEERKIFL
jgi:hypothetical protein